MLLCINCKYFEVAENARNTFAKCTRGRVLSPVDGSPTPLDELPYCSVERNSTLPDRCQLSAIYFQSNLPFDVQPIHFGGSHV